MVSSNQSSRVQGVFHKKSPKTHRSTPSGLSCIFPSAAINSPGAKSGKSYIVDGFIEKYDRQIGSFPQIEVNIYLKNL